MRTGSERDLASRKIAIRRYRAEDAVNLFEAARESVKEVFPWLPWCHPTYSLEEAQQWTASRAQLFDEGAEYSFAIVDNSNLFLGGCGLNHINPTHRLANLGYWVRTSEVGRGVASAAVQELAVYAFSHTKLVRLEIVCAMDNQASHRVAEKAGASREGILHDRLFIHDEPRKAVMYSLTRSKWRAV